MRNRIVGFVCRKLNQIFSRSFIRRYSHLVFGIYNTTFSKFLAEHIGIIRIYFKNYIFKLNSLCRNYYKEIKNEIQRIFKRAKYIIDGKDNLNPKVTAMITILEGCSSKGHILGKKSVLYTNLY